MFSRASLPLHYSFGGCELLTAYASVSLATKGKVADGKSITNNRSISNNMYVSCPFIKLQFSSFVTNNANVVNPHNTANRAEGQAIGGVYILEESL
ncbi:hypothetical protein IEQ34_017656 [Dendrobium chrysotoxum]|uniref:Uncharacterized protein n=1 Tax=Dendrobium chrysotoxum TaxID=161865 RepID=A0AAV7GCQ6_DENCH|nr:hypothetical protein IEQ34_017656 [Dendrobium chrysotoxum]